MDLSRIIGLIKTFLPKNSPWFQKIDQAAEMAKGFAPNKDGISQLMEAYGKNRDDLHKAVGMLENPMVKNLLSRIPGLGQILNGAANDLMNDPNIGVGNSNKEANCGSRRASGNSLDSLQARLERLK